MEHKRYRPGTVVRSIVVISVSSTVSIRFTNQFVPCVNGLSHQQRRGTRHDGVSIVQRRGSTRNIMINVRWGTNAPAQKTGDKVSKVFGKTLDPRLENEHSNRSTDNQPGLFGASCGGNDVRGSPFNGVEREYQGHSGQSLRESQPSERRNANAERWTGYR